MSDHELREVHQDIRNRAWLAGIPWALFLGSFFGWPMAIVGLVLVKTGIGVLDEYANGYIKGGK